MSIEQKPILQRQWPRHQEGGIERNLRVPAT